VYERPTTPDVRVDTAVGGVGVALDAVVCEIERRGFVKF
jgi:hypothetical protein